MKLISVISSIIFIPLYTFIGESTYLNKGRFKVYEDSIQLIVSKHIPADGECGYLAYLSVTYGKTLRNKKLRIISMCSPPEFNLGDTVWVKKTKQFNDQYPLPKAEQRLSGYKTIYGFILEKK